MKNISAMVTSALLAAFTCVATMILKIPTPGIGYIHFGDVLVLLCGFILGPAYGALAAGVGSALADLFGGYAIWAPGTFVIKAFTAWLAGMIFMYLSGRKKSGTRIHLRLLAGGLPAELFMTAGYFGYQIVILMLIGDGATRLGAGTAAAASAVEIPFNLIQGAVGIAVSMVLYPILARIPLQRNSA